MSISEFVSEDSTYFGDVESVFLNFNDGQVSGTDNLDADALFGDNDGDYFQGGINLQGENTITIELYSEDNLGGEMLGSVDVKFSVS